MEKRFTLALLLSLVVIVAWQLASAPPPGQKDKKDATAPESSDTPNTATKPGENERDPKDRRDPRDLPPAPALAFSDEEVFLENEVMAVTFTNRGGAGGPHSSHAKTSEKSQHQKLLQ